MDDTLAASVVLSAAGQTGHCELWSRAAAIAGADLIEEVARGIAEPWMEPGGEVLLPGDPGWPQGLDHLGPAAPVMLWVRGRVPTDPRTMVAVVGARRCTDYGSTCAADLAGAAVSLGRIVVSGGAFGIDGAAHAAALRAGGSTVLFAAGGAGRVYPSAHAWLFGQAARSGAVVWEHPPGVRLTRGAFLHRNRLIAASAGTTILVEAAERSGALNTGRTAADLGRLVLAVPGPITSAASAGVHRAIADGWAALLLGTADLTHLLEATA
jgi:DNA processing protein